MRTIFVRPGARRPYVPYGALRDARGESDRLRALAKTERERGNSLLARALAAETLRDRYANYLGLIADTNYAECPDLANRDAEKGLGSTP